MKKQWEQQPNETETQYRAFQVFLGLEKRSYEAAYREYGGKGKRITRKFFYWAKQNDWKARARAFDEERARRLDELTDEQHRAFIGATFEAQRTALQIACEKLGDDSTRLRDITEFLKWSAQMTGTQSQSELNTLVVLKNTIHNK